jgi:hypothetical protein
MIAAMLMLAALHPSPDSSTPTVADIVAGYRAWDIKCDESACSTQASDRITTIALKRSAAGLGMMLAARRCADTTSNGRAFIEAKLLRPGDPRQNAKRAGFVFLRFVSLDARVLKSCGLGFEPNGRPVYDPALIDRFLQQSEAVAAAASGRREKAR